MGRPESLGRLKPFLWHAPQLSGASPACPRGSLSGRLPRLAAGWAWQWAARWSRLSSLRAHHQGGCNVNGLMAATSFVYWPGGQYFSSPVLGVQRLHASTLAPLTLGTVALSRIIHIFFFFFPFSDSDSLLAREASTAILAHAVGLASK